MAAYDFSAPRLFLPTDMHPGVRLPLERGAANYLRNVLRLSAGDPVLVFNGRDGEWRSRVEPDGRRGATLAVEERVRAQTPPADLVYLFAPLKAARLDYMAQKAVEMGASVLRPVFTRRTQASRINLERLRANAVEAVEQCGILSIPEVGPGEPLAPALAGLEPGRLLVFCDEEAGHADPIEALRRAGPPSPGLAVLIGPEGGFAQDEREAIAARPHTVRLSLGPRVLRADTAAVAALALIQAVHGDWR